MRGAPRAEDEFRAGPGLHGQEDAALAVEEQAAVQALARFDAAARVRAAMGTARDLGPARSEPDGVVARDEARIAAAQHVGEVGGEPTPRGDGIGRHMGEAPIEVDEERGQEGIGALGGGDAVEPELDHEAVLQRAPKALDATFGLRRAGRDVADAEILQDATEVGRMLGALELLLHRPVAVVPDEDVQAIAVEGQRESMARRELSEQRDVAVQILGRAQDQGQAGAAGRLSAGGLPVAAATAGARPPGRGR